MKLIMLTVELTDDLGLSAVTIDENETDLPSDSALVGKVAKALLLGLEKQPEHFAVGDLLRKLDIETEEKE